MGLCAPWHSLRLLEWNNWRVGCTQPRWATGNRSKRNPYSMARTLSLLRVRAVTFSLAFARSVATASGLATADGVASAGGLVSAKFFRQQTVILNIDKLIPFLNVLPESPFMAHSNFLEHALRCRVSGKVVRKDSAQVQRLETKRDCGARSFRGVPFAPEWHTDPVAELRTLVRIRKMQSHRAAKSASR